ncbi:MAG TPA: DUF2892 domain-containing protein [Terriglobales bacterium]|nr:DUF2892 domain-containing protein [Terriglobales bacterium]
MTVERALRMLAGFFVMLSVALGHWVSHWWFLLTAFVGLNLFQSAFTNWCPAMTIFRKIGLKDAAACACLTGNGASRYAVLHDAATTKK